MVSPDYEAIVTDRFKDDLTAEVIWRLLHSIDEN